MGEVSVARFGKVVGALHTSPFREEKRVCLTAL